MVRQYREELSSQTTSNYAPLGLNASRGSMFLKNEEVACEKRVSSPNEGRYARTKRLKDKRPFSVQKLCWHETPIGTACSLMEEKTGTCTPLRFRMDDLADLQDLDRRATEVLRRRWSISRVCSQQLFEGGQACKSSAALMSKLCLHLNDAQAPSDVPGYGHCPLHSSGSVERRSDKNHYRARDVVARNFEEIDKILGEINLVMEQSSSHDVQLKVSDYKGRIKTRQVSNESVFELRQGSRRGVKHLKQDMEAREGAAIKAPDDYLNMNNGHSDIVLSERLLENPYTYVSEELITCRRLSNPSGGSLDKADEACCPSTFNANKQQGWQTTVSLHSATLESCNGAKICDEPTPNTSSVTPTNLSESKWLNTAVSDGQWLNKNGHLDSGKVDSASMMASKGAWKYADELNFGESQLGGTKSLDLNGRLPLSRKLFAFSMRKRPITVDTQQFPLTTKKNSKKKYCRSRVMSSIQMSVSHVSSLRREVGVNDPASESQSYTGRLTRGVSSGPACLEDGMKQLSTEDLLLAFENRRKLGASLRSSFSKDQSGTSDEGRRTYWSEQKLSPGKCLMFPTFTEFKRGLASSFAGGLDGNDKESTAYAGILASQEEDQEEAYDRTSTGSRRYLLKVNTFQRSKVPHSELATQLLCSSAKSRRTKDKDNKYPAWMHSPNVRKPSKWRAMPFTHTRLQASAASLVKGTVVVEELEELSLRCNQPNDAILAASSNNNKERGQENFPCKAENASTLNDNFVSDHCEKTQAGHHFPTPVHAKIIKTRKVAPQVSKLIASGPAEIVLTSTLSGQAGRQLESCFALCSNSYQKHRTHGSNGLTTGISLPSVLTVQEDPRVTSCFVAQKDSILDNLPTNESTFLSELDCLISKVVHEWVQVCSTSSPTLSASSRNLETRAVNPVTTCSTTDGGGTLCPGVEESSPKQRLKIVNGMQDMVSGNRSADQDLFGEVQGLKPRPSDSELVKVVRKSWVATLASVVQPLLAALQVAEIDKTIVTEFEADETLYLLLDNLQFCVKKLRVLMNRQKGNFETDNIVDN